MTFLIVILFIVGYLVIAFEHVFRVNKAATALLTGVLCWTVYALTAKNGDPVNVALSHHLTTIAEILFFLLGAMVIVELIDAHDGFEIVTEKIQGDNKKKLIWITGFISFFLSAVLDNLTTSIVMISLVRKLIPNHRDRLFFAGLVVIAANAGGAWSPIGDITTTMLWMGKQVTTLNIMIKTFAASWVCFVVPAFLLSLRLKGTIEKTERAKERIRSSAFERKAVFILGVASLLFVPVFKTLTGLPPYMGILFGLGAMWLLTEIIHHGKDEADKGLLSVNRALRKIDTPSILFFLGILLSVAALESAGILHSLSASVEHSIGNARSVAFVTGLLSALVDNVPLVAAAQGMYGLEQYPTDHYFWEFMAYCAGTGGSILVIGSAAGVAAMGMERIPFFWWVKNISWLAVLGYLAGAAVFLLQQSITG